MIDWIYFQNIFTFFQENNYIENDFLAKLQYL